MISVPPDGPIPCDLAVVGEAPSHVEVREGRSFVGPSGRLLWKRESDDMGLIETIVGRPRETCYVSNVCKEPVPDVEWRQLNLYQREVYENALLAELEEVSPRVVLAFGMRAAKALVPDFGTISQDHGKPVLGHTGKYVVMALWHPAAYLRGNREALGKIAEDLTKVEGLLADGVVELMRPAPVVAEPEPTWVEAIAFLVFKGTRKTGKCLFCGGDGVASYKGEGLEWKLCKPHATRAAQWAETNLAAMREHAEIAAADSVAARKARTAARMEADLRAANERRLSRLGLADGASGDTQDVAATELQPQSEESGVHGGSGQEQDVCVGGASGRLTEALDATSEVLKG